MSQNIYSTAKIVHHPEALEAMRKKKPTPPILVQWMPTNVCNHSCGFCSYGAGPESIRAKVDNPPKVLWKNQQLFGSRDTMPPDKMRETLACLNEIGVKAIELTGGGEPTAYPLFDEMVEGIGKAGMDLALVTNGTLMPPERVERLEAAPFIWVRVSIDAGTPEEYTKTRHVPESHWHKAWWTVSALAKAKSHPEARVGVGFVVDRDNWQHIYEACHLAKEHGADNIRVAMSFTPDRTNRWGADVVASLEKQIGFAKEKFEDATFHINDLSAERIHNVVVGAQEYAYCGWKEIGCVIGADSNVYACCSWAYNKMGLMFSIKDQSFKDGWYGDGWAWRKQHDPRTDCRIHCLYEERNMLMLNVMGKRQYANDLAAAEEPIHKNFV